MTWYPKRLATNKYAFINLILINFLLIFVGCQKNHRRNVEQDSGETPTETPKQPVIGPAGSDLAALRYLSFAIRDVPPSVDEANALTNASKSLNNFVDDWRQSSEHIERIKRFFDDMIGVSETSLMIAISYGLDKNDAGIYHISDHRGAKGDCDVSNAVNVAAWWLGPNETVKVCPSSVSSTLKQKSATTGKEIICSRLKDLSDPACGCGPSMVACYPNELKATIYDSVRNEFRERAAAIYLKNGSWFDLIGGSDLYANRYLAWVYLYTTKVNPRGEDPSADELLNIQKLPIDAYTLTSFPKYVTNGTPSGNLRAGIVTAPGFLSQFNTFRARIRGLVQGLLCKDIDGSLGSDIKTYMNPNFSAFDRSHGIKEGCSDCHYPMDNMASLNFGWDSNGRLDIAKANSVLGHAFGRDGNGPEFLARSFVEQASGFSECMAKRTWESFSGLLWNDLPQNSRDSLTTSAGNGPHAMIDAVIASDGFRNARLRMSGTTTNSDGSLNFNADIRPILVTSCGGSSCHGAGGPQVHLDDNEGVFKNLADKVALRIAPNGGMPPASSGKILGDPERSKILKFLGK